MTSPERSIPDGLPLAHLQRIASLIRSARKDVVDHCYEPKKDRWGWGISCLVFERICTAIWNEADTNPDVVKVITPRLQFVFGVPDFPLRFYRGRRGKKAPDSHLRMNAAEAVAVQESAFPDMRTGGVYRLMYETDRPTLLVTRVFLVEIEEATGEVWNAWAIPSEEGGSGEAADPVLPITAGTTEVTLPAVNLEVIEEIIEEEEAQLRHEREAGA